MRLPSASLKPRTAMRRAFGLSPPIFRAMSAAFGPETRMIPTPPLPGGVAMAAMVSEFLSMVCVIGPQAPHSSTQYVNRGQPHARHARPLPQRPGPDARRAPEPAPQRYAPGLRPLRPLLHL